MRRLVTSLFVAFAVLLASAAFTAFWLQQTVFSPQRSEIAAQRAIQAPFVTKLVVDQVDQLMLSALPPPVVAQLGKDRIRASVSEAVRDPQVVATLTHAFAQAHRGLAAGGANQPVVVDGAPVARAIGASLSKVSPQVGQAVAAKPMQVQLPSKIISDLSRAKDLVDALVMWCGGLALLFAIAALGVSKNRAGLLQHLGGWMIGLTVVQFALAWVLPTMVLPHFGSWGALAAQISSDLTGGTVTALIALLVAGVVCVIGGRMWAANRRSVASLPQVQPLHA
jgi:hypothetical protein